MSQPTSSEPDTAGEPAPNHYDVVVIGGGMAGGSAAIYLARYGLSVLMADKGKSSIRQCAFMANYPGFPEGVGIDKLLELFHAHAQAAGAELVREKVVSLRRPDSGVGFLVSTDTGPDRSADRVIAASAYDVSYLEGLPKAELGSLLEVQQGQQRVGPRGRTPVGGLYFAGLLSGCESQAVISAGQAADTALGILEERLVARDYWPGVARYVDWVVHQGRYEKPGFDEKAEAHYRKLIPEDWELPPETVRAVIDAKKQEVKDRQITREEVRRREREAQVRLLRMMDDEVIEAYLAERRVQAERRLQ
jgi:hypothetical protein